MAEFHADTLSFVGNFSGSCIIYLNGEAITIKQSNGMEVAKWPYNCIRQFRAEEEHGKFSFVSGRRGPYGVAEYNFSLSDSMLSQLQSALTQFTGAQFNQVAQTGPGLGQQQVRPRPPSTSSTSSYGTGSRSSMDASPIHRMQYTQTNKPPATPPRDYLHFPSSRNSFGSQNDVFMTSTNTTPSPLLTNEDNTFGGYAKARTRMINKSASEILSPSGYATPPPRLSKRSDPTIPTSVAIGGTPPLPQESWVLKSQSYEQTKPQQFGEKPKPAIKPKPDVGGVGVVKGKKGPPPIPPKRSPLTEISSVAEQQDNRSPLTTRSSKHSSSASNLDSPNLTRNLRKQQTEPSIHHHATPTRLPMTPPIREHVYEDADNQTSNLHPSTYDVVPKPRPLASQESTEQDLLSESEQGRKRSKSFSPEPTLPKIKEEVQRQTSSQDDDPTSSSLDFLPRSSPQVRVRSITPEQAQNLRRDNAQQSPSMFKRSKTVHTFSSEVLPSSDMTYDVPKSLQRQSPDEGVYNVPKPLNAPYDPEGTYHVPRPSEDVYHVPRSREDTLNTQGYYHHPKPADSVYKVPVPAASVGDNMYSVPKRLPISQPNGTEANYRYPAEATDFADGNGVYQVPKSSAEVDNVYKVPRSVLEEAESQTDNVYKVPKSVLTEQNDPDNIYNVPRSSSADGGIINGTRRHNSSSPPLTNTYETIDSSPRPKGVLGRLRAARSFESLLSNRVNTTPVELSGPQITANPNLYVGVDVDKSPQRSPQRSPLAQRRQQESSVRAVTRPENVYAEIPDDMVHVQAPRRPAVGDRGRSPSGRSHYDTLPLRGTQLELEGLSKAQALHEEEGYELVLPPGVREEQLRAMTLPHRPKNRGTTPPRQLPAQPKLKYVQDKYGIDRASSRRHSEGLAVDSSCSSLDRTPLPSETLLSSSIPADSTLPVLDEYVIITRQDTTPKHFNTPPQPILAGNRVVISQGSVPSVGSDSSISSGDKLDDSGEYELMNSVRVNMARLKYNTPNPTMTGGQGSAERRQQWTTTAGGGESSLEHFYGNTFHTASSVDSMNSPRDSVFSDKSSDWVESGSSPTSALTAQVPSKKLNRVGSGGPQGSNVTLDLRNRSCSVDDILDGTSRSVEKSPSQVKKHNYINVTPEDELRRAALQPATTNQSNVIDKRPMPLPRSDSLVRQEGTVLPSGRRPHSYERVDPVKVKGNNNPLSSNEPDTPQ